MKRFLTPVFTAGFLLALAGVSSAVEAPRLNARDLLRLAGGTEPIPAEWSGIWSTVDSLYDCTGNLQSTSSSLDTLCTGQIVEPEEDPSFEYDCTGTTTPTTVNMTCTGQFEVVKDCFADYVVTIVGTRTNDTYFMVTTITTTFSGTGEGCDFFPDQCMQFNSHGTKIAPEPAAYCATPVEETTWGQVKSLYR